MVHSVPLSVAGGWLACALAFALWSYGKFNRMRLADPQLTGMAEYRLCHRHALYSALLWGALFWVQGPVPTLDQILSMWTFAVLMRVTLSIVANRSEERGAGQKGV